MRFPLIVMCSMHHNRWEFVTVRIIRQYYAILLKQVVNNAKTYENYTENLEKFRVKCYTTITNKEEKRKKNNRHRCLGTGGKSIGNARELPSI